ncbi:MAG: DUF2293 domain-containing protein [Terriglobales bacterium]
MKIQDPPLIYAPGPTPQTVRAHDGAVLNPPDGWVFLRAGDAALTRRVKAGGAFWTVAVKRGRKLFCKGIWAPESTIQSIRVQLEAERSTETFASRKEYASKYRARQQSEYSEEFLAAVIEFLKFHPKYAGLAQRIAEAVTTHAIPVGSKTVARTKRIPLSSRAELAVLAWMRHKTTEYDTMKIAHVRGKRREVRKKMARISISLLGRYRSGEDRSDECPLQKALDSIR